MSNYIIHIASSDRPLRRRLERALTASGFAVSSFESGYPVAERMDEWPDLYIIDIELSGINGLEVCRWLKSRNESSHVPVVLLSGEEYLNILAASASPNHVTSKPVSIPKLTSRIAQLIVGEPAQ